MIFAAGEAPSASLIDPAFWVNVGAVGVFLYFFITDKVYSRGSVERLDKTIERLISERDRALAERDEMIEVMKDFTHSAGAILQINQPPRKPPSRRQE